MKKIILMLMVLFISACSKVPAGHVGVKVYLLGSDKGVQQEELGVGRYWIGFNEELYLFPTFTQNSVWDKNETIIFQTKEGLDVSADIGVTYHIDPDKVTQIFQTYRRGIDEITDVYVRNYVKDSLTKHAARLDTENIYGEGKGDLINDVQNDVAAELKPRGIIIEKVYWVGTLRLPDQVVQSINSKISATQKAQQRENEVRQAEAEARKAEAEATGQANSIKIVATAEASAIEMKGRVLANNPLVIEYSKVEKWNGVLPTMTSGAIPLINIK